MVANIVFLGRSTLVIAFWTCFSCSTESLDRGEVAKFLGVSSVENSLTAWTIGFRKQRSCLKSNTPNFICWCLRKSLLSFFSENFQLDVQILLIVFFDLGSRNFPKSVRIFAKILIVRTRQFVECWSNIENHLFSVEFEVRASVFETEPGWIDDWSWVYNKLKCFFFFLIRICLYFLFGKSLPYMVSLTYESRLLINSNKYCDQTSLANEMVVFGQKQIKFLLNEKQPNWSEKASWKISTLHSVIW